MAWRFPGVYGLAVSWCVWPGGSVVFMAWRVRGAYRLWVVDMAWRVSSGYGLAGLAGVYNARIAGVCMA